MMSRAAGAPHAAARATLTTTCQTGAVPVWTAIGHKADAVMGCVVNVYPGVRLVNAQGIIRES